MEVKQNEANKRFEVDVEGMRSVLDYEIHGTTIYFTHTGVPGPLEGRGIGKALAKAGLDYAREKQLKVEPACSFIRVYMKRHPEYNDLMARS